MKIHHHKWQEKHSLLWNCNCTQWHPERSYSRCLHYHPAGKEPMRKKQVRQTSSLSLRYQTPQSLKENSCRQYFGIWDWSIICALRLLWPQKLADLCAEVGGMGRVREADVIHWLLAGGKQAEQAGSSAQPFCFKLLLLRMEPTCKAQTISGRLAGRGFS